MSIKYVHEGNATAMIPGIQRVIHHAPRTAGREAPIVTALDASLESTYEGSLLTSEQLATGNQQPTTVTWIYSNDFRVESLQVNAETPIAYAYEPDGLLTQVGTLELSPDPVTGLLDTTTLAGTTTISDHLGSIRSLIDIADATIAQAIDYDEWGNAMLLTGTWDVQPFGFAGGTYDAETLLVRFGVRDYDPVAGRWTAKDPIGLTAFGTNHYGDALLDPVDYFDPDGENALLLGMIALVSFLLEPSPSNAPASKDVVHAPPSPFSRLHINYTIVSRPVELASLCAWQRGEDSRVWLSGECMSD